MLEKIEGLTLFLTSNRRGGKDEETYILDLEEKFSNASNEFREKYFLKEIDEKNIEITVKNTVNLNELFELLDKENIKVKSIREKQNRVEALFMKYLKK